MLLIAHTKSPPEKPNGTTIADEVSERWKRLTSQGVVGAVACGLHESDTKSSRSGKAGDEERYHVETVSRFVMQAKPAKTSSG